MYVYIYIYIDMYIYKMYWTHMCLNHHPTILGMNTSRAGRRLCHARGNAKGRFARALDVGAGIGAATWDEFAAHGNDTRTKWKVWNRME